jgi:hypothetical protein
VYRRNCALYRMPHRPNSKGFSLSMALLHQLFRLEELFFRDAEELRVQLEKRILSSGNLQSSDSPLESVHVPKTDRHLTAWSNHVFDRDVLSSFLCRICDWSREALGASHASTPQLKLYTNGCSRTITRDSVKAKWHYMLCLTKDTSSKVAEIRVLTCPEFERTGVVSKTPMATIKMRFNQLLVHEVDRADCREPISTGPDLQGSLQFCWVPGGWSAARCRAAHGCGRKPLRHHQIRR